MTHTGATGYIDRLYEVPGMIAPLDANLFIHLSEAQGKRIDKGDLLEIGAWFGRSAILLGYLRGAGERLHVCDLFETIPPTEAGRHELVQGNADTASRDEFEGNFRRFHSDPPVVHQCPSSELATELQSSVRFVHIDGSHTYEAVVEDIALARGIVPDGGLVVFDDFSNIGHPGVAAGLWPSLARREFEPFALTPAKLYATVGASHAAAYRGAVEAFAANRAGAGQVAHTDVNGSTIVTLWPAAASRSPVARGARWLRRSLRRRQGRVRR